MKTAFIQKCGLIALCFMATSSLNAQEFEIKKGVAIYKRAPRICHMVNLDPEPKTLRKAWGNYLKNNYIDNYNKPIEFNALEEVIRNFLKEYLPIYHQGRISDAEKRVKKLARERENLNARIVKDSDKIEKLKLEIQERTLNLAANKAKLDLAESKLEIRKEKMRRISTQFKHF